MKNRIITSGIFAGVFIIILSLFIASIIKTNIYNSKEYEEVLDGDNLFTSTPSKEKNVTISISQRDGSWGKIFDFNNEGLTENNYTASTYDFSVVNNTNDEVKTFSFRLDFKHEAYISQAWNGSVEFHQHIDGKENVVTIPDLRVYNPKDYNLKYYFIEDEPFIEMQDGDYIIYHPSAATNAVEMPIKAQEGTTPGIIMYVKNGENIKNSVLTFNYTLYRLFTSEVLFWISFGGFALWIVALILFIITSSQIKKYNARHERDNEIINESIETFTGFIDAKDSYTNGHSKRVAIYTRLIAKEMGYEGEELDRIYYIALLHDCGKIGVPDNILGKPGRLTDEEFEIIKSHTVRGGEILSNFKSLENAGEGALYHHERYDGRGYPKGLKGEEIPLIARMICVADSFDAMNSSRVYRKNLSKEYIINELKKNQGTQFDPEIAEIMFKLINEGKVNLEDNKVDA